MCHGMLAYPDWKQDFTLNIMVVKVMFGLARPFTGKNPNFTLNVMAHINNRRTISPLPNSLQLSKY
jgi:hypothetical protein